MTRLIVSSVSGFGKCVNADGTQFTVLRADGLYNLSMQEKGSFTFWVKENVKRVSTLQRFADDRGFGIQIEVI